jgi:retinol dehydrogenase 12
VCWSNGIADLGAAEIAKETGFTHAEVRMLDQSSFASVSPFIDELEREDARVDVLLANAGLSGPTYEQTLDGRENRWAFPPFITR